MLFDSITEFSARSSSFRIRGIASARSPVRVLTQNDRTAPAARYRAESVPDFPSRSSLTATVCSAVSQSHGSPLAEHIPWPNCVILNAVHRISGIAAISPATTLVFPMFLVCPPTTTIAIFYTTRHHTNVSVATLKTTPCTTNLTASSTAPDHANTPSKAVPDGPRTPLPAHAFFFRSKLPPHPQESRLRPL